MALKKVALRTVMTVLGVIVSVLVADAGPARRVKDIVTATNLTLSTSTSKATMVGTTGYMLGWTVETGTELWKTDGTAAGTVLVKDICPGFCNSVSQLPDRRERDALLPGLRRHRPATSCGRATGRRRVPPW